MLCYEVGGVSADVLAGSPVGIVPGLRTSSVLPVYYTYTVVVPERCACSSGVRVKSDELCPVRRANNDVQCDNVKAVRRS